MREFLGLKTDHHVQTALFIASSGFMPGAQDLARRHDLTLLDSAALLQRIHAFPAEVQQRLLAVATEGVPGVNYLELSATTIVSGAVGR